MNVRFMDNVIGMVYQKKKEKEKKRRVMKGSTKRGTSEEQFKSEDWTKLASTVFGQNN